MTEPATRAKAKRRWPQITLASLFFVIAVVAAVLAVRRAQQVALERQRRLLEELEPFAPQASWNSDGVWSLEFRPAPRRLDDEHLAKLGELPELWAIDLRNTQITDQGLRRLATFSNLRWVTLPETGLTEKAVREFQEQRPDIKVIRFPQGSSQTPSPAEQETKADDSSAAER